MTHPLNRRSYLDIASQIREFEKLDRSSLRSNQIEARVRRIFGGYSCITRRVEAREAWRARRLADAIPYRHVKDLWYPPADKIKTYGRLNRPGQSMLYVSASHHSAILEMRPEIGERFVVLQMRLRNDGELPHVMELGVAERATQHGLKARVHLVEQTAFGRAFLGRSVRKNMAIRSFLARELTKVVPHGQEDLYRVGVAIADILMESRSVDGVEYPCMAGDASSYRGGVNLALKPVAADRLFVADSCWVAVIEGRSAAGLHVRCERRARSIGDRGDIQW